MLWQKMIRDLKENKGSYIACTVVIVMGLLVFTAFSTVVGSLRASQQKFYEEQNFADGFIKVQAIPQNEVKNLERIDGIKEIQGRLVKEVIVLKPGTRENVYLRLVSVDPGMANPVNGVLLIRGRPLDDDSMNVWIDNKFSEANNLDLNSKIEIIAGGKVRTLTVTGVGNSPEFVYTLRTPEDVYPSPETFGIAFIPIKAIEKLFPDEKYFNELVFTLKPGADYEKVKEELENSLKPYGVKSIIPRAEQMSHMLLDLELKSLESISKAMPVMFLSVAGMILYITLKRLIELQRGQIGILKAEGFTSGEILFHYMSYALTIGLTGGLTGSILGAVLSYPLTSMYQEFFNLPGFRGRFSPSLILLGVLLSLSFSLIAGYQGCKKVLALEPAEAIRPPAPIRGRRIFLEKIGFLWKTLNVQGMMAVRNLSRNTGRSLFIFLGILFCFTITTFTWSANDVTQKMLFDQYEKVEVYDVKITLARPLDQKKALRELEAHPGVSYAEPMAEVPVTLKNRWLKKDTVVLGLPRDGRLYNILDKKYNKIAPPKNGILLSERLSELLNAGVGTKLTVESPMKTGEKEGVLEVVGIIPQYVGVNAYMELGALQEFLNHKGLVTSIMLRVDQEAIDPLRQKYMSSEYISSIDERSQRLNRFKEMMASYGSMLYIYALIGVLIGFAIIYSSSVISMSERSRELASMMVLGMTQEEVVSVVTFEQWCIGLPALIAGIPASKLMMAGLSRVVSSDMFTMPDSLTFSSLILSFAVTAFSIWIAQKAAARKVRSLNPVEVLKARE
ncbi:ABC transporter permease [Thermosediminibacter litoriperuensis]|uniref:Putative ABC transport system permease protein n=1 Tax=Thermosediminibacter litoriperuensis TaxID=291989 RepID=A0A5S5AQ45_9FIRM|nr:FtsX-like permease family protein [Thermosediminibacter litoriperuensis]TYP53254.1 putative ABC transport system permease protein [Thermosediminibacter litoriperuensis]